MARLISTELRPIRQGHVWMWLNRNRKLPPEFVLVVESLTGVSRYALRPDIFGASPPLPSLPAPTFSSSGRGGPSQRTALEAAV